MDADAAPYARHLARRRAVGLVAVTVLVAAVLPLAVAAVGRTAGASDASPGTYTVTLAARSCPSYTDITANRARNNIMESLRDLGGDTPYTGDEPVSPSVEAEAQPNCTPITNWHFTFGNGIAGQVTGPWGALSTVSNPEPSPPATLASTPLLDDQGDPTGQQIAGAVTVTLTAAQVEQAEQHNLWIQGGLATDPVENSQFPDTYGFGALRCAADNVNGDNVEWVGFPQGSTNVFCFAYYVTPPPTSGTIVVTKQVPQGNTDTQTFDFTGNTSYEPDGAFSLGVVDGAPASQTFIRAAGGAPWTVDEDVPVNWQLTDLTCVSGDGDSTTTTTGTLATIDLAAGDTVTCTYTDAPLPPAALTIEKVSYGGVGTFPFTITGGQAPVDVSATTTVPGVAVDTGPTTLSDPGQYTITEDLPTATGGAWTLTSVTCDGTDETPVDDAVTITVAQGDEPVCTFTDTFDPDGVIAISKVMNGALGDADFVIGSDAFPGQSLYQTASPTAEGVPALATGDASDQLPLGTYSIEELVPSGGDPTGWSLDDVTCNGSTTPVTAGVVTVTLTAAEPTADCTFTDSYSAPVPPTTTTTSTTTAPTTTTTAPATLPAAPEAPIATAPVTVTG
jgi:hypothetical protein